MKGISDGVIGFIGSILATGITIENINVWVSVFCSVLIAVVTCFVQVYRIWRDRNSDIKNNKETNDNGRGKESRNNGDDNNERKEL